MFSQETELARRVHKCIWWEVYQQWAHMIAEAKIPISPVSWLETQCFSFESKGSKTAQSQARSSVLVSLFYSRLIFNWLDEAHPHWGGQSAFLSPPIEMCISPGNTCTDTPRITPDQISRYPVTQSSWHTKVNRHAFLTKLPVVPHFSLFLAPQPE